MHLTLRLRLDQLIKFGEKMDNLAISIALIGAVTGLSAFALTLYKHFYNRKPRLRLFAPWLFTCSSSPQTIEPNQLRVLVRISNLSSRIAFLYFETMDIQLIKNGRSTKALLLEQSTEFATTDFGLRDKVLWGTDSVRLISRFDELSIPYDSPLVGYICLTTEDKELLINPDKIKFEVRDCHWNKHILEVDFKEQLKFAPYGARGEAGV